MIRTTRSAFPDERFRLRSYAVVTLAIAFSWTARGIVAAPSADYRFVNIATGQGPVFWSFGNYPSINIHGTVAFNTILSDHSTYAVYKSDGASVMKVVDAADPIFAASTFRSIQNGPTINDSGIVAFGAYTGENGVWKTDGTMPTLIYQPDINIEPSINESGAVAFDVDLGPGREGIVVASPVGSLNYIVDASDNLGGATEPTLNDFGKVVFMGYPYDSSDTAIYTSDGGPLTTIVNKGQSINGSAPIQYFGIFPTINNLDEVVFTARHTDGAEGIYRATAGAIETLLDTSGPFASFESVYGARPVINHNGDMIFYATLDGGGSGIFSGPDPVHDRIIGTGDTLFGKTVYDFAFGGHSFNSHGQFTFQALSENGNLIVRIDPIPEPATYLLMVAIAMAGTAISRPRRVVSPGNKRPAFC